jgi:hypothetical protein
MNIPTRPDTPADPSAARRNYIFFSVAAVIGTTALVAGIVLLLV